MNVSVLIVEDNAVMRAYIRGLISDVAATIYEANNGNEAVAMAQHHNPDLIFMDIRMPELDGIEATRKIVEAKAAAKVVIVTEFDTREYRRDAEMLKDYYIRSASGNLVP